jgi:hypothetical protein
MAVPTPASKGFLRYSPAFEESLKSSCPRSLKRTRRLPLADGLRVQRPKILPSRTACSWAPRLLQLVENVTSAALVFLLLLVSREDSWMRREPGDLWPQESRNRILLPDISAAQYGCVRQHLVFDNLLSTPAFDCNMGCHLAGDHLVGRFSGNLLDATLGGGLISLSTW